MANLPTLEQREAAAVAVLPALVEKENREAVDSILRDVLGAGELPIR